MKTSYEDIQEKINEFVLSLGVTLTYQTLVHEALHVLSVCFYAIVTTTVVHYFRKWVLKTKSSE